MSSPPSTVYFITGTNRGIGLGLVTYTYIAESRPDAFIYAGVRDPTSVPALDGVSVKYPTRVVVVKYVSADTEGNTQLAKEIEAKHVRVDTLIANAGLAKIAGSALDTSVADYVDYYTINVVTISSAIASFSGPAISQPNASATYGSSKAALNYITRKIHFENDWLTAFPLAPGAVIDETITEKLAADHTGEFSKLLEAYHLRTPDEAAVPFVTIIDQATREKDGGEFLNIDGARLPW